MRSWVRSIAIVAVVAMAAACSNDAGGDDFGGAVSINVGEPAAMTPVDARDTGSTAVVRQLFAGLLENDAETGEPQLRMATSIDTEDNVRWTIELEEGWTFHDGTPVTAQSYADAWTATAQSPVNGFLFQPIAGFGELVAGETDELAGVEAVDEHTLEVELSEPFSPFYASLADHAFSPLPEAYFEDPEGFATHPIGNGRYQMDGDFEEGDQEIVLRRYEDYAGERPGAPQTIAFQIYDSLQTAYLEAQEGNLDIVFQVPSEEEDDAEEDFDGRMMRTDTSSFTFLGFPLYDDAFADPQLRRALSLAVDREQIIDALFSGVLEPASAIIPPVLDAHRPGVCDACEFDPDRARELLDEAGGWDGTMTFYFNTDGGNEEWIEAVANQFSEHLGIDDVAFEALEFGDYIGLASEQGFTGPFRLGWALEYFSPQYALELYTSGSGSNFFGYASEEFDEAYREAGTLPADESTAAYQRAEDILLEDLPLLPLWYGRSTTVWSERVDNVVMDPSGYVRVEQVQPVDADQED